MVPGGTLDCIRVAYYTLCDLVQRYGEMGRPRFGEVRLQAWVTSGSKKASSDALRMRNLLTPTLGICSPRK